MRPADQYRFAVWRTRIALGRSWCDVRFYVFGVAGIAKTSTVGAPGFRSTQKFDGLPDATATYCLPATE